METNHSTYLSQLLSGDTGIITNVKGKGAFRKRITEMGFVKGKRVEVIKNAPLFDPIEYRIMGYNVSLRRAEADLIEVDSFAAKNNQSICFTEITGRHNTADHLTETNITVSDSPLTESLTIGNNQLKVSQKIKGRVIHVALVGNPNSGKTTLFNCASGSHERVGNYGGVTVDSKEATIRKYGYILKLTDLPGTYSITEYTPEELFVRMHLQDRRPDVVVNVIDASNIERNLFLTTQLIDMNIKVVMALNMYDELEKKGSQFNYEELGRMIGIPIVPTIAVKGAGIAELVKKIIEVYQDKDPVVRHIHINYGNVIEGCIASIQKEIRKDKSIINGYSTRYLAIKLLENDNTTLKLLSTSSNYLKIQEKTASGIKKMEDEYKASSDTILTDTRYGFISGALLETLTENSSAGARPKRNLDDFLTNKWLGFPIFIFFMWLMFQTTFTVGNYPMEWIDAGVGYISSVLSNILPPGDLHALLVDGIIGGVGGVIIFLPNILILFFFISLMEDTGYMARVSFIMDRLMHRIGLHGKSFIPLLMGFGCNVPAIMATRTLENRKDRIMTMMIAPFMSCSARLPVYVLIISAFFVQYQGLILFSVYIIGVIIAVIVALVLKKTVFVKQDVPFVMELPPYRIPTLKNTTIHMWNKGSQYLKKMGSIILLASILIWSLSYYPKNVSYSENYIAQITEIEANTTLNPDARDRKLAQIELSMAAEHQQQSYIGRMGRFIEPAIQPLGFDWKIGISLITGLAAKEIVVGTMGILYQADLEADENSGSLISKLQNQVHTSGSLKGKKVFEPLVAYGFMLFILIYFPCIAVIAAIKKESNIKWAVFSMVYTTAIAWIVAFITYQLGSLL